MRHARLALAVLAAACTIGTAPAQTGLSRLVEQADKAAKNFNIADRNHDGLISREEAAKGPVPFIRAHFDAIDTVHRGAVSRDDLRAYLHTLRQKAPAAPSSSRL